MLFGAGAVAAAVVAVVGDGWLYLSSPFCSVSTVLSAHLHVCKNRRMDGPSCLQYCMFRSTALRVPDSTACHDGIELDELPTSVVNLSSFPYILASPGVSLRKTLGVLWTRVFPQYCVPDNAVLWTRMRRCRPD
eukprot:5414956-Amphidinium_carterae.1